MRYNIICRPSVAGNYRPINIYYNTVIGLKVYVANKDRYTQYHYIWQTSDTNSERPSVVILI